MKTGEVNDNSVYYRLYKYPKDGLIYVVTMQDFDECDYIQDNFVKNKNNEKYYFEDEIEAINKLNEWFDESEISFEYKRNGLKLVR